METFDDTTRKREQWRPFSLFVSRKNEKCSFGQLHCSLLLFELFFRSFVDALAVHTLHIQTSDLNVYMVRRVACCGGLTLPLSVELRWWLRGCQWFWSSNIPLPVHVEVSRGYWCNGIVNFPENQVINQCMDNLYRMQQEKWMFTLSTRHMRDS